MAFFNAMVTFESVSGFPADRYINNLHFQGPTTPTGPELLTLSEEVEDFYNDLGTGQTTPLEAYLSEQVAASGHTIKVYELDTPPPHLPLSTYAFSVTIEGAVTPLPSEVACVLSFHGDITAGTDTGPGPHLPARHRNRIYFGPLNSDSIEFIAGTTARPKISMMEQMCFAANALNTNAALAADGWSWAIWSPTRSAGEDVRGGWVDNAFDTQRRRGAEPNIKRFFGTTP